MSHYIQVISFITTGSFVFYPCLPECTSWSDRWCHELPASIAPLMTRLPCYDSVYLSAYVQIDFLIGPTTSYFSCVESETFLREASSHETMEPEICWYWSRIPQPEQQLRLRSWQVKLWWSWYIMAHTRCCKSQIRSEYSRSRLSSMIKFYSNRHSFSWLPLPKNQGNYVM